MEVFETIQKRRSVRRFTQEKISKDVIDQLLIAAQAAPSACNKRPWDFYAITNSDMLGKLKQAGKYTGYDAPLAIVVVGDLSRSLSGNNSSYWIQDCSAATENILLMASALGLGAVWCGLYPQARPEENVHKLLGLKQHQIALNIIYVGYPLAQPEGNHQYETERVHFVD